MSNVSQMPASENFTPELALKSALTIGLSDVLILGYDEAGHMIVRSSRMTRAEALFMLEKGKDRCMGRD